MTCLNMGDCSLLTRGAYPSDATQSSDIFHNRIVNGPGSAGFRCVQGSRRMPFDQGLARFPEPRAVGLVQSQ